MISQTQIEILNAMKCWYNVRCYVNLKKILLQIVIIARLIDLVVWARSERSEARRCKAFDIVYYVNCIWIESVTTQRLQCTFDCCKVYTVSIIVGRSRGIINSFATDELIGRSSLDAAILCAELSVVDATWTYEVRFSSKTALSESKLNYFTHLH